MDEKDQKTLTIGDILDQLVKPSVIQSPSVRISQPGPAPVSSLSSPSPVPRDREKSGDIRLPSLDKQIVESRSVGPASAVGTAFGQKDAQSGKKISVRTMRGDLARIKQGLLSAGFETEKVIISSPQAKKDTLPLPRPPVSLPEIKPLFTDKGRLPPSPGATERPAHIHEETRIADLGLPIPKKKVKKPEEEKIEYRVIARVVSSGMTTGIAATVIFSVAAYLLIYYFFIKEDGVTIATPIPTAITTPPVIQISELESIFQGISVSTFAVPNIVDRILPEFKVFIERESLAKKEFRRVSFHLENQTDPVFSDLMQKLSMNHPPDLAYWLQKNGVVLIYGQTENFDNQTEPGRRIVFIVEVKDTNKVSQIMKNWEPTIADDLKNIFSLDPAKQALADFLDNERQGIKIRYKNFPFPDKSIDYAIVSSLAGKNYLVLTNSRESMFSPVDKIRGL